MIRKILVHIAFGACSLITSTVQAVQVVWDSGPGANFHTYEVVLSSGILWESANTAASGMSIGTVPGYLATSTSAEENAFITGLLTVPAEYWLGGFQSDPNAAADETWTWVSGERWDFTNWRISEPEPNDGANFTTTPDGEEYLGIIPNGEWNDQGNAQNTDPFVAQNIGGYVVEYNTPVPVPAALPLLISALAGLSFRIGRNV